MKDIKKLLKEQAELQPIADAYTEYKKTSPPENQAD